MAKFKDLAFQRLLSASREKDKRRFRSPWRTQTQKKVQKATSAEKTKKKLERLAAKRTYQEALRDSHVEIVGMAEKLRQQFGKHSLEYYLQELMQTSRVNKKGKQTGHWNAFVSQEVKRRNENCEAGKTKLKAHELMTDISTAWHKMSKAEQVESTKETLAQLRDTREMRDVGTHNVPIAAFHDTRTTLLNVSEEIKKLHARTNLKVLLIGVRSNHEQYTRPFVLTTSDRVNDFMVLTQRETPNDFAIRLEGYCLSGVQGVTQNYVQELSHKRKKIATLITIKLREAASGKVARMNYQNFASITERFSLVIKGWPLKTFCAPSDISSRTELDILLNAWTNGTAWFYKMSRDEYNQWLKNPQQPSDLVPTPTTSELLSANTAIPDAAIPDTAGSDVPDATAPAGIVPDAHEPSPSDTSSTFMSRSTTSSAAPVTSNFVNVVQTSDGAFVNVTKKARKPRKDKGQPRKKRRMDLETADASLSNHT
ncbi:hypothetical protein C0991_011675 [Blastosporella zonata]|nr:hypothetical protein C0991_011675 [Blastosporella zonata]